eukprot:TRINITY_DN2080_c0_g1_i1.p1 TRINITY_DN2080_c0_g1~~TRINITY_DN2080_c0_g1_i1.p1  ORF type:complete len:135 (-),score=17.75 TRINITY_DN2080_c0_g1_i1:43-417(-)
MATKKYSYSEVWKHRTEKDLWVIYEGKVLDVTEFLKDHPGGEDVLMEYAGTDLTQAFADIGHSEKAVEMTSKYVIGVIDKDSEPLNRPKVNSDRTTPPASDDFTSYVVPVLITILAIVVYYYYK